VLLPPAGRNGSVAPSLASTHGNAALFTSGTCSGGGFRTFYPGPRIVYYLYLGEGAPLGGALTVTTCGATANNTVLYVGTGCPTWSQPFACLRGNDDAADDGVAACPGNPRASTLVIPDARSRSYFVMAGGANGADVRTGLTWSYAPAAAASGSGSASKRPAASQSAKASRSRTASRTRSRSATRTRTRKPKRA